MGNRVFLDLQISLWQRLQRHVRGGGLREVWDEPRDNEDDGDLREPSAAASRGAVGPADVGAGVLGADGGDHQGGLEDVAGLTFFVLLLIFSRVNWSVMNSKKNSSSSK